MKLGDSSFWLAHALAGHPSNAAASRVLAQASPRDPICFCRSTQQSVLRLLTVESVTRSFGSPAFTNKAAWQIVEDYLSDERVSYIEEPQGMQPVWERLAVRRTASPKLWMDAYLAAFAIASGCQFVTADEGFRKFKGLDLILLSEVREEKS